MIAVVALFAGTTIAQAQNAPTSKAPLSSSNINKGTEPGAPSGNESHAAATGHPNRISGSGKFCKEMSANGALDCVYASMNACKNANKSSNLQCVANPKMATTGSK